MQPPNSSDSSRSTSAHPTLLIVDDDAFIRESLRFLFEDTNYTVLEASNGEEALTMLRQSAVPLVVLLDELMPRLSGEGVLRTVLRDRTLRRRHTFILLSAVSSLSRRLQLQRLLQALAIETVPKPFDIDDLEQAVARAQQRVLTRSPFQRLLTRSFARR